MKRDLPYPYMQPVLAQAFIVSLKLILTHESEVKTSTLRSRPALKLCTLLGWFQDGAKRGKGILLTPHVLHSRPPRLQLRGERRDERRDALVDRLLHRHSRPLRR